MENEPTSPATETWPKEFFKEGMRFISLPDAKESLRRVHHSLTEARQKKDTKSMAWGLLQMATLLRVRHQYKEAQFYLEEARGYFSDFKNNLGLALIFYELAYISREMDRNTIALEYAHQSIKLLQEMGQSVELGWAYDNMAGIQMNLFHRPESLAFAKKARAIFMEFGVQNGLGWNGTHLAGLYLEMGFAHQAEQYYLEALKTFEHLNNHQGIAWVDLGLGTVYRTLCQFDRAMEYLKKARILFEELELKDVVGWSLLHEAAIKRILGHNEEAMLINKRALQLFTPHKATDGVAWSLFQMGQILRDQGQLVKAWQTLRESLNLHTDISNRKGMGWTQNEWGETYLYLNDIPHAQECFIRAKVHAEQLDEPPLKIKVEKNLAHITMDYGHFEKASVMLDTAEELCSKSQTYEAEIEVCFERLRFHVMTREISKARQLVAHVEGLIEKHSVHRLKPMLQLFLGEINFMEGKQKEAFSCFENVLMYAKKLELRYEYVLALMGITQVLIEKKITADVETLLAQIKKLVRMLGTRKLKAKLMMISAFVAFRKQGTLDGKGMNMAVQVANAAGLTVLEMQFLELARAICTEVKDDAECRNFQLTLDNLLARSSEEVRAVFNKESRETPLPVSLVV